MGGVFRLPSATHRDRRVKNLDFPSCSNLISCFGYEFLDIYSEKQKRKEAEQQIHEVRERSFWCDFCSHFFG